MRSLIVDDEKLARENLRLMLDEHCKQVEVVGTAASVEEALNQIKELKPELVFLDIRMPAGAEGIEMLDNLETIPFMVVFVTAFRDYAVKGFRANGIPFVLKPLHINDLEQALEQVSNMQHLFDKNPQNRVAYTASLKDLTRNFLQGQPSNTLTVTSEEGIQLLVIANLELLEAGPSTRLYLSGNQEMEDSRTLRVFEELLDARCFFRISKEHIVRLDQIRKVKNNRQGAYAVLKNRKKLPVSTFRLAALQEAMHQR